MIRGMLERNGILFVTAAIYLAGVVGIALGVDRLVYQVKKRELITDNLPTRFIPELEEPLSRGGEWRDVVNAGLPSDAALEALREAARGAVAGSSPITAIRLVRDKEILLEVADPRKAARFSRFENSLLLRDFVVKQSTFYPGPEGRTLARLRIEYATPASGPPEMLDGIRNLTSRYRRFVLMLIAAYTGFVGLATMRLILPLRNVTRAIDLSSPTEPRLIRRPLSRLEGLYNRLARDAILSRLEERLGERIQEVGLGSRDLIEEACDFLASRGAAVLVAALEIGPEGTGRLVVRRGAGIPEPGPTDEEVARTLAARGTEPLATNKPADSPHEGEGPGAASIRSASLEDPERPGSRFALGLALSHDRGGDDARAFLARLVAILRGRLDALMDRRRSLSRERDRAGINLSRNLGHDLTNAIATSKFELMTLQAILGPEAPPLDARRRGLLDESLRGLLDSTRFMQEVVNLYRAYAFLREPVREPQDPNALVADTIQLFRLSTSDRLSFVEDYDPEAPALSLDPRLLKLALFNLFSNALQAIRRGADLPEREGMRGEISVSTRRLLGSDGAGVEVGVGAGAGVEVGVGGLVGVAVGAGAAPVGSFGVGVGGSSGVEIVIRDNGPGIRDESGELASPEAIGRIFALGYTAGRKGEGEGLGLNWVRTIVEEIHGGTIRAENHPEGGAVFRLRFAASGEAIPGDGSDGSAGGASN